MYGTRCRLNVRGCGQSHLVFPARDDPTKTTFRSFILLIPHPALAAVRTSWRYASTADSPSSTTASGGMIHGLPQSLSVLPHIRKGWPSSPRVLESVTNNWTRSNASSTSPRPVEPDDKHTSFGLVGGVFRGCYYFGFRSVASYQPSKGVCYAGHASKTCGDQ